LVSVLAVQLTATLVALLAVALMLVGVDGVAAGVVTLAAVEGVETLTGFPVSKAATV
jgi:hypothetical protein